MAKLYRVSFKAEGDKQAGDWFAPQGLGAAMDRVKSRMKKWDGPYRQRDRGDDWGPPKPFNDAASSYRGALEKNNVGDIRIITGKDTSAVVMTRKVEVVDVDYPDISSNATPAVKNLIKPLWDEYPQLASWGVFNCRRISGSSSWSQHAWADAIDLHAPTMAYGDQVNRWLNANKGRFNLTRVLWRVAGHYDHLHVDFDPDRSGTPPCA
jgi:hypothetical protein